MFCFAGCKKEKDRVLALYEEKIIALRTEMERVQCSNRSLLLEIKRKEELIQNMNKKKQQQKKKDSAGTSNGITSVASEKTQE